VLEFRELRWDIPRQCFPRGEEAMATFAKSWRREYLEGEAGFFEDFDEWFPVVKTRAASVKQ